MKAALFRKATALFLTLVMLMTCVSAWATTETSTVVVDATVEDQEVTVDAIEVIEVTPAFEKTAGLEVLTDGNDADIEVKEGIVVQGENVPEDHTKGSFGVLVDADGDGGEIDIEIGADGVSVQDSHGAYGIQLALCEMTDLNVSVTVDGPVEAVVAGEPTEYNGTYGINVDMGGSDNSTADVEINGNVTASGYINATGLGICSEIGAGDNAIANVHVAGDVNASTLEQGEFETTTGIRAESLGNESEERVTVDGSISVNAAGRAKAAGVFCDEETATISITAGEDFEAVTTNGLAEGIYVDDRSGKMELTAGGNVSASSENGNATGVYAKVEETGSAAVEADGNIQAQAKDTAYGVNAEMVEGQMSVETGGNVTAEADNRAVAIYADVTGNGSMTVRVHGGVKAETTDEEISGGAGMLFRTNGGTVDAEVDGDVTADRIGIAIKEAEDVESDSPKAKANVDLHGDVSVTARGLTTDTHAVDLFTEYEGTTYDVNVDGDVSITGEGWLDAVCVDTFGGSVKVTTGGDISAIAEKAYASGVNVNAQDGGEVQINVGGGVSASVGTKESTGLNVFTDGAESKVKITVADGITADSGDLQQQTKAIRVYNCVEDGKSGEVDISTTGDVKSTGKGISIEGNDLEYLEGTAEVKESEYLRTEYSYMEDDEIYSYKVYYNAEGDYYYNEWGDKWQYEQAESGLTRIEVKGDVQGDETGLEMNARAITDVIVDGTLEGGENALVIADETMAGNLILTVWEIKPNADGSVAEYGRMDENGKMQTAEAADFEKEIQYIIRLEQPEAGATLSTLGTYEYESYNVAHEGETVVLQVNLEPGYEIVDAFNGTDTQVCLLQDADGNYYLVVPRGGAVLLSVKLRKKAVSVVRRVRVTINPDGGMLRGKTEPYSFAIQKDSRITLPEAPTKEGETFLGWYGTEYPVTDARWSAPAEGNTELLQAQSQAKVTKDYYFTAVWKKAE